MEVTPKSKKLLKVKIKKVAEDKFELQESSPLKVTCPVAQSTPSALQVPSTSAAVNNNEEDDSENDDEDSPFRITSTQDTLNIVWEYPSPLGPHKKSGSKAKRKLSKADNFGKKKYNSKAYSPVEPERARRRYNVEKCHKDFSKLLLEFETVVDKGIEQGERQNDEVECDTSHSSSVNTSKKKENASPVNVVVNNDNETKEDDLNDDFDDFVLTVPVIEELYTSDTQKLREECVTPPLPELNLVNNQSEKKDETFTALFDDSDDECMVQCTQEIEEILIQNKPLATSNKLPLIESNNKLIPDIKSSEKKKSNEKNDSNLNSKESSVVGGNCYIRIKTDVPKYSNWENVSRASSHKNKAASASEVNSCKLSIGQEFVFDDSFDDFMQQFTEDDIEMLSQGVTVDKKELETPVVTKANKLSHKNVECKRPLNEGKGSVQSLNAKQHFSHKVPSYVSVTQTNSGRQMDQRNNRNLSSVRESASKKAQFQVKVPSATYNNNFSASNYPRNGPVNRSNVNGLSFVNNKQYMMNQDQYKNVSNKASNSECLTSNAIPKPSPQKCTPEEIQKKRLEAKKKLEKKKLSKFSINR